MYVAVLYNYNENFKDNMMSIFKQIQTSGLVGRVNEKVDKMEQSFMEIVEDRNLEIVFENPYYLLVGAGQGYSERFEQAGEIHSTLISIWFSYGIIPLFILCVWIYRNIRGLKFVELIPYIAILIESFILLNQRQLLLWVFILLASTYKMKDSLGKIK